MPSGIFTLKQQELALGQGAWTNQPPISVNYLVVAGGGGGAGTTSGGVGQGGGGAGGLLQGSLPITPGTSYTVTVGAGGNGGASGSNKGSVGSASVFGSISASGGGGGANYAEGSGGGNGGSGGGSAFTGNFTPGQGIFGQGNAGGFGGTGTTNYGAGGGGGAGTVGLTGTVTTGGNGGAGIASDISGIRTAYAGGGGGGTYNGGTSGSGGAGGGGAGTTNSGTAGAGSGNTGGGGGGNGGGTTGSGAAGGAGGSGIVIISYPGTTQWFTGGTLSYANGNVIHTFYSSGTLAPTAASNYINTDYQITRSLRFNSADSAYLDRTPGSAGNQKTWTISFWTKINPNGNNPTIIANNTFMRFGSTADANTITVNHRGAGSTNYFLITTPVYRDPSSWYHVVWAVDTTQATESNRSKIYVNGVQVTAFSTANYPPQNQDTSINASGVLHYIGRQSTVYYYDGYLTEYNLIDGQALNPYSFGYYNPNTGIWSPLKFVGTYGTNGFYLNFSDNSGTTSTTLGKDNSGNGNNWTPNNFSVTAGAGNDSLVDTPTPYGTDTGAGGEVRGNYCTLNPLDNGAPSSGLTLANGNLQLTGISSSWRAVRSTVAMSSGKWYCEATVTALSGTLYARVGLATSSAPLDIYLGYTAASWVYINTGNKSTNLSNEAYGASWTTNDVIGIAFDADAGTLTFYKNGVSQGQAFSGLTSGPYFFAVSVFDPQVMYFNFGQRPFAYTAPSGFKALCTQNLPTPTIGATATTRADDYFDTTTYTGTGATQSIVNSGPMQPDFVWIKSRSVGRNHRLMNAVRGINNVLSSDLNSAEYAGSALSSLNSNGFTLNTSDNQNINNETYVAWQWKANGAGSSNTAGTITSTVSANTTAGFSIVTYTGNATAGATVGHGCLVNNVATAPSMIFFKLYSGASNWIVYHASVGATKVLVLNTSGAEATATAFNNTAPSSTVFTLGGTAQGTNDNSMLAYCFAPVAGYSSFGSYTGNGSTDGPFVFCGFRPRYVLIKRTDAANDWVVHDTARDTYNVADKTLYPNLADAEFVVARLDILSNGFKLRSTSVTTNANGGTYVYACFAESPFKYALAR